MIVNDKFEVERLGLLITLRCNLKCKLCSTFAPYYENAPHFSLEILKKTVDKLFIIFTYVNKLTIIGGETLLHEDLPQLVTYLELYSDKFGELEIVTNGTIVPSDDLVSALKESTKIKFLVDDYGTKLSRKIDEIEKKLHSNHIEYVIRKNNEETSHCNGWIDFGDLTKKRNTQKEIEQLYSMCAYPQKFHFCFGTSNGEIHPCTVSRRCMELGIIPKNREEFVDLFNDNISIEEQRRKIENILQGKSLTACAYCNGMCEDSQRFIPAEQIK